ncbi:5'-nucleotidase, lipoprotein e(P4) family [Salmonella enterica subsp. enterica serovar Give]|nr:5'-nucleotidase, lipoprotein e(P4) family [Salmonella enterica]EBM9948455.1 5'-nucleotidase, lipoprotein e(P4) family [Salmonella enterica subsp. enterica serovar Give]ECI4632913.1 5'-nucleotidase, lipoprotein e(P4) family [Salmonella enterica subsp. enterica serovar Hartford]EDQ6556878.1 5'-nucleotidase, lipoprotein e(P4) family [Salmonella enterica subsp. enterica]EAY8676501.1 5'-nucleotidase, lipoprotein e(P4) family [Salmonella enterica]
MNIIKVTISIFLSASLVGCADFDSDHTPVKTLALQNQSAVLWMQKSGEYRALAYQAFNTAKLSLDEKLSSNLHKKNAVIVDLDETMLDNSPYSAWQLLHGQPYTDATWSLWVRSEKASAIPGAVEFAHYVVDNGGYIFYVSNRSENDLSATLSNMKKLNFPNAESEFLRLKPSGSNSNKKTRFNEIKNLGYNVVMYIGDNINDFTEDTYHKNYNIRMLFSDANKNKFGIDYIVIPNPSYGDWESSLAQDYFKKSASERIVIRNNSLKEWSKK